MPAGDSSRDLAVVLRTAFAPLHKRALGLAVGLTVGFVVFGITVFHMLTEPAIALPGDGLTINLLGHYFFGYDTTWRGAFIGLWWGFFSGFVAGWFVAFCRNFILATWMLIVKTRAELTQTRDFLDHI